MIEKCSASSDFQLTICLQSLIFFVSFHTTVKLDVCSEFGSDWGKSVRKFHAPLFLNVRIAEAVLAYEDGDDGQSQ